MTHLRVLAHSLLVIAASQLTVAPAQPQGGTAGDSARAATAAGAAGAASAAQRRDTLESVIVRATRAPLAPAAARHIVTRAAILRTSSGQDAPLALQATPSVTTYSEAGSFSGYSYVRLRGLDQTRLNITLDGVPLNDPEDQVLYFSNVPDFLGSMSSVEVVRGVGGSTFGTAPFAGSLNFQSIALATAPRGGQLELTAGSFGTWRASVQGATGVGKRGFAGYGRFSRQGTEGYREHSGNDSWSGFGSAGWFGTRDALKVTAFAGLSGTRLAYYAASEAELAINRRVNPLSEAEGDRFHQEMVSAQYSRAVADGVDGTLLIYRNSAAGAYDVRFAATPSGSPEFGNYGLAHVWSGITSALNWTNRGWSLSLGGTASDYHRDHSLAFRPTLDSLFYSNRGVKREASAFAKSAWVRGAVRIGADISVRYVHFRYRPSENSGIYTQPVTWSFVNPKLGATWDRGGALSYYVTAGRSWREPTRSDLFAGADDLNRDNANNIVPLSRVHPEKVDDFEAGIVWRHARGSLTVNAFAMEFHNEIAAIGPLSLTGSPLRKNVESSYRRGVELDGTLRLPRGSLTGNLMLLRARIAEYNDEAAGASYRNIEPVMTPPVIANLRWDTPITGPWALSFGGRHVARMHLANDGNDALVVPASTLFDAALRWARGRHDVRLEVNNLLDANAYGGGYTDGTLRYFYPIASRNLMLTARLRMD